MATPGAPAGQVVVPQMFNLVMGHYQNYFDKMTLTGSGTIDTKTVTFPFPINLLSGRIHVDSDKFRAEVSIAPDTLLGNFAANEAAGQTVLSMPP